MVLNLWECKSLSEFELLKEEEKDVVSLDDEEVSCLSFFLLLISYALVTLLRSI